MRRGWVTLTLCGIALVFASPGGARHDAGTADLLVQGSLSPATPHPVAGQPFELYGSVFNNGPDPSSFTLHVQFPDGVDYAPEAHRECAQAADPHDLVCAGPNNPAPVGDDGSGRFGNFTARAGGSYDFVFRLTDLGATDPNLANDQVTVTVAVARAQSLLVPSRIGVKPSHPRAGRPFSVSFVVIDKLTGRSQRPSAVRCRTSIGGAYPRRAGSRAICTITTPPAAKGKVVRVALAVTAGGKKIAHVFAVPLS